MYGKPPLRMRCPHCDFEGEHSVVQTDPHTYHISDTNIFYRRRMKCCCSCGKFFHTAEMEEDSLKFELWLSDLRSKNSQSTEQKYAELRAKYDKLQEAVDNAARALLPHQSTENHDYQTNRNHLVADDQPRCN